MKKNILTVLIPLFFLAIVPVTVYAFNNNNGLKETITTGIYHESHHRNSDNSMKMNEAHEQHHQGSGMMDSIFMNEMMEKNIDCSNEEEHNKYIEEQKQLINAQLETGLITPEEANEKLNKLEAMQVYHIKNHQEMIESMSNCHK